MTKVTRNDALKFVNQIKLDLRNELFTLDDLTKGMNVELEHGTRDLFTNVTNNDLMVTGKIALAHLNEFPDYYKRLARLESEADIYWKGRPKKRYVLRR